jgi:hypothetical protein
MFRPTQVIYSATKAGLQLDKSSTPAFTIKDLKELPTECEDTIVDIKPSRKLNVFPSQVLSSGDTYYWTNEVEELKDL